jgi:hypothetical protein
MPTLYGHCREYGLFRDESVDGEDRENFKGRELLIAGILIRDGSFARDINGDLNLRSLPRRELERGAQGCCFSRVAQQRTG